MSSTVLANARGPVGDFAIPGSVCRQYSCKLNLLRNAVISNTAVMTSIHFAGVVDPEYEITW